MTVSKLKFAISMVALAGGLAASGAANAGITLPLQGLKTKAVLTFTPAAYGSSLAAGIQFGALGNAVRLPDVTVIDPETELEEQVASFDFPVTRANVSVGWDLKIKANYGDSVRSALQLKRPSVGRSLTLANFHVNFSDKVLYADFIRAAGTSLKQPLYTFVETVPQKVSLKNLVLNMTVTIGNLMLPVSAQDALGDELNLSAPLRNTLKDQKWGEIDIQVTSYKRTPWLNTTPFTAADIPQ